MGLRQTLMRLVSGPDPGARAAANGSELAPDDDAPFSFLADTPSKRRRSEVVFTDHFTSTFGQPMEYSYHSAAREGFRNNELVFACIREHQNALAEAPPLVRHAETDEVLAANRLTRVLAKPNPHMDWQEFLATIILHYWLAGNAFIEKVRNAAGEVVELWPLRPDRMRIVESRRDFIGGYIFHISAKDWPIPTEDIIHLKIPDPLDDYFGFPPIFAASRSADLDNEASAMSYDTFRNKGINPGIAVETESAIDKDTADRLREQWRQKFEGMKRGEPAFLQAGMKVRDLGFSLNDLAVTDIRDVTESRLAMVFRVPPIMLGAHVGIRNSTYSNFQQARKAFWEDVVGPEISRLEGKLNADLVPEFTGRGRDPVRVAFSTENVSAMQELRDLKWSRANKAFQSGLLSRNEARRSIGYDDVDGQDVFIEDIQGSAGPNGNEGNMGDEDQGGTGDDGMNAEGDGDAE